MATTRPAASGHAPSRSPARASAARARARHAGPRPPRPARRTKRRALLAAAAALLVVGAGLGTLYVGFGAAEGPTDAGAGLVAVEWPEGLSAPEAAALLADLGLVRGEAMTSAFLRASGGTTKFVPGSHLLPRGATPWQLRDLLERKPARPRARVTIPEGYSRFEIGARLEKARVASRAAFLRASEDPLLLEELGIERPGRGGARSAEGYLFPATYELHENSDPSDVVRRLVAEGHKRWKALAEEHAEGLAGLQKTLGWGRREAVVLASVVEKEAALDAERPLIASVFLNRLLDPTFSPKRLQSDPTSAYGCLVAPEASPACAGFAGKVTPAMNQDPKNRYSTYAHPGLPPGPIANPGARSLAAVLAPAATRYFYFVAEGGGRHAFSEDLAAHNAAVRRLRERATR